MPGLRCNTSGRSAVTPTLLTSAPEFYHLLCFVDLIKLRGNVKVLKKGDPDPETGETKSISLYRSKDDPPSLKNKNGRPVGRLYLKNVNVMVPVNAAMIEVHTQQLQSYHACV